MINDYLFEMSDSDLNRSEMIYDCHFEMTAKNFGQRIIFVNKIDFDHQTAEMETQISVPAAFLFSSASEKSMFS